jgi:hypothetical protein
MLRQGLPRMRRLGPRSMLLEVRGSIEEPARGRKGGDPKGQERGFDFAHLDFTFVLVR